MREIGGAIVSITLVMMLVFIPVSFMSGTSGVFYRQFGLTMAIAIGLSALNALTLSPALCAVFLKPHKADGGSKKVSFVKAFHEGFNRNYEKLLVRYKKWAGFFINHKITAFGVVAASIVALAAMMMTTSTALVPNEDTGVLFCMVNMPPATSLDKTEATLAKVDKILAANPAVESRTEILGYSFIAGQGNTYGTFIVKLKDWSEREKGQDARTALRRSGSADKRRHSDDVPTTDDFRLFGNQRFRASAARQDRRRHQQVFPDLSAIHRRAQPASGNPAGLLNV